MATLQTLDPQKTIPKQIEDLTLLDEVSARTAGVSRLEMCIQCGTSGGSCPLLLIWTIRRACYSLCCEPGCVKTH